MRNLSILMCLGTLASVAMIAAAAPSDTSADAEPERVTLLGTLAEWKYPESELRGDATMSDGGDPSVGDLKCHAVLVTPASFESVCEFYSKKLDTPEGSGGRDDGDAKPARGKAITVQDDSGNRPVALRVINVDDLDRSTTLVVSRASGEAETHIVWTHYRRFPNVR